MASDNFTFNPSYPLSSDMDVSDWNTDTSMFLYDSPQPDPQNLPSDSNDFAFGNDASTSSDRRSNLSQQQQQQQSNRNSPFGNLAPPQNGFSLASSEESDSQSSSSDPMVKKEGNNASLSPPDDFGNTTGMDSTTSPGPFQMNKMYSDMGDTFQMDDSAFPSMGAGMDNLSLDNIGNTSGPQTFDFGPTASPAPFTDNNDWASNQNFEQLVSNKSANASPQMTVQPSKTFMLGGREDSPNSAHLMNSHESSPGAFYSGNSPLYNTMRAGTSGFEGSPSGFSGMGPTSVPNAMSSPASSTQRAGSQWPCRLTVDPTPEKSRVETQIPIKLTLYDIPKGITKVHLPPHTISKPKFQSKPTPPPSEDMLELSTMLVCASAMQKDGVEEQAFQRAANEEEPVKHEDLPPNEGDENDPNRPLNGGPVAICGGCIVRERKRAARKKTKKVEEEEEWAKDEAKRVIVFNCSEVRDWCVPGSKDTPVKEHDQPLEAMYVDAPMRIACYCRHQSEKVGFQVIFTLKTFDGTILAQAISNSIMITDDHKQPMTNSGPASAIPFTNSHIPGAGVFSGQQLPIFAHLQQEQNLPFRTSWSTNDLQMLRNHPQMAHGPPSFHRQFSHGPSQQSTASTTPRNLSRPASPTYEDGHSNKKRRSGGPGHQKVPSGLTMTRIETRSPTSGGGMNGGSSALSSAPQSAFSFASPTSNNFGPTLDQSLQQSHNANISGLQSGPPTPSIGVNMNQGGYGSPPMENDPFQYYSAPTSQRQSRATSPNPSARMPHASAFQPPNPQVPQQAAFALSHLPAGLNLQKPPLIQRLIPNVGPRQGGNEVTILGSGFCQGLEVMFGDQLSPSTTYWGDTTLVTNVPPSGRVGPVPVVFKHQHHTAPAALQEVQALMPARFQAYSYVEDEKIRQQGQNMGLGVQHGLSMAYRQNVGYDQ